MFSEIEKKAIDEKLEQLNKVISGTLSPKELSDLIVQRRISWFEQNKDIMFLKYNGLSDLEKAYKIIFFDHMQIKPKHSELIKLNNHQLRINSYNFCPYLEACEQLGLDTKFVCKEIGEPSIQEILKRINPNLRFSRNYHNIRPSNKLFCEEYITLVK